MSDKNIMDKRPWSPVTLEIIESVPWDHKAAPEQAERDILDQLVARYDVSRW